MTYPLDRLRRLRYNPNLRTLLKESYLQVDDLIYPLFVMEGEDMAKPVLSMPGVYNLTIDKLISEAQKAQSLGLRGVLLFGLPEHKDASGSGAYAEDGIIQRAVAAIKEQCPNLLVFTDVCLCEYTDHGHCGLIKDGQVLNDETLAVLARVAVSHARSGADLVAPSDMMDGRVGAIRTALDENGFANIPIMSYSVKYASAFYGPFREAADSAPQFGDRKTYQMDPANQREAIREVELDIAEGADIIMVKPALAYMDIISMVRNNFHHPVAAYNVSGEYAMVKAAAQAGWIDEKNIVLEMLTGMKRAGADIIVTYHALDVARWLGGW